MKDDPDQYAPSTFYLMYIQGNAILLALSNPLIAVSTGFGHSGVFNPAAAEVLQPALPCSGM